MSEPAAAATTTTKDAAATTTTKDVATSKVAAKTTKKGTTTTETNVRSFYITFSLISLCFTFGLIICLFFNKDIFIYLLVTYLLIVIIYLHIVNLMNLKEVSTNAFTSLKQSSVVIIYAYISIIALMVTYYLMNKLKEEKKSIYSY